VTRRLTLILVLAVVLAASLGASAHAAMPVGRRVTIVLAPYLTWDDIREGRVPAIARLAARGAVGDLNLSGGETTGGDKLATTAISLSAGAFARGDAGAPAAFTSFERLHGEGVGALYARTTGVQPRDDQILYLGLPRIVRANEQPDSDIAVGALGQAIERAGGTTAAIGNSDVGLEEDAVDYSRPAAIIAMDARGRVSRGDVSERLLVADDTAPFGRRTDLSALGAKYRAVLGEAGSRELLVVLDPGDPARAAAFAPMAANAVAERQRERALRSVDALASMAEENLGPDSVVMIVSPLAAPGGGFTPLVVAGRGWSGVLESPSTHRPGIVTLPDVTATVLSVLRLPRPSQVLGNALVTAPGPRDRIGSLQAFDALTVAVDGVKPFVLNAYIIGTVLLVALLALLLFRAPRLEPAVRRRLGSAAVLLMLFDLAIPPAAILMHVLFPAPSTAGRAILLLLVTAALLWVALVVVRRLRPGRVPLAVACLAMAALALADQWLSARYSVAGFFSYSMLVGARYYGLGNEGASLLVASSLVGATFLLDEFAEDRALSALRRFVLPLLGAVVVVTAAAPSLGANVGVVLWGTVAFAVAAVLADGRNLSWRTLLLIAAIVAVLVGTFSALDLTGPATTQTHLARALMQADKGDVAQLSAIVWRKIGMSARVFSSTSWSYLLVALLVSLGYIRWRPRAAFSRVFDANPAFAAAVSALLLAAIASLASEDSGVVMPALMMLYVGIGMLYLMVEQARAEG